MARYTGPTARRWRRLGEIPPDGSGIAATRRQYPPGQHGLKRRSKMSEFGLQLQEKQKAKYTYGLLEKQFRRYYAAADRQAGITGENLMRSLELRLDNVVYRLGLATTRAQARQAVGHGHVLVDSKKVDIPSFQVSSGQKITLGERYRQNLELRLDLESLKDHRLPSWLDLDAKKLEGTVLTTPERSDIDATINEQLIIEFYSR